MSLKAENEHRVSRKLTVNVNQHSVNIRPIIKGTHNIYFPAKNNLYSFLTVRCF